MSRSASKYVQIDPDGFYKEYKRIAKAHGGVEALSKEVAPDYHNHYLSGAKRIRKVAAPVFNNLVNLGADPDIMQGKEKHCIKEVLSYTWDWLRMPDRTDIPSDKESFIASVSNYIKEKTAKKDHKELVKDLRSGYDSVSPEELPWELARLCALCEEAADVLEEYMKGNNDEI